MFPVLLAALSLGVVQAGAPVSTDRITLKTSLQPVDGMSLGTTAADSRSPYLMARAASMSQETQAATSEPAPAAAAHVPAGNVVVRTIDAIDSKSAQVGQTFKASLDAPITIDGVELPRGSEATLKLIEARSSGLLKGKAQLTITLVSIAASGKVYEVNTGSVVEESGGKGKGSAAKIGIGAGAGAALGGIFGGGKGAAIGAGAGAAAGTAVAATTGPQVKVPSETQLTFQVQ